MAESAWEVYEEGDARAQLLNAAQKAALWSLILPTCGSFRGQHEFISL